MVRVCDEVLVDLMAKACGVTYQDSIGDAVFREINAVRIPFASPQTLVRMKQTVLEKDALDRAFLQQLIAASEPKQTETNPIQKIRRLFE